MTVKTGSGRQAHYLSQAKAAKALLSKGKTSVKKITTAKGRKK